MINLHSFRRRAGRGALCVAAAAMLVPGAVSAQAFQNGSFENGTYGDGTAGTFGDGSTAITGWTVKIGTASEVQWQKNGNPYNLTASDALYALDLTGVNDAGYGGVEQTFTTIAAHNYSVSFDVGTSDQYTSYGVATVQAFINGTSLFSVTNSNVTAYGTNWLNGSSVFTASSASTKLGLFGTAGGHFTGLDNVKVTDLGVASTGAVPEPATWGMMMLGFGLAGAALRRGAGRRTRRTTARFA